MLSQLARESHELRRQLKYFLNRWIIRVQSLIQYSIAFKSFISKIPDQTGEIADGINRKSHSLPNVPDRSLVVLLCYGCNNCRSIATVFLVYVLHHFLSPFVFKIHIDVRWLIPR